MLTAEYNPQRTGVNANETCLTSPTSNFANFQNQGSYSTDGAVYAQPLYVRHVHIGTAYKNVLIVATLNDSVYAFNADNVSASAFWTTSFIGDCGSGASTILTPIATLPQAGVLSTPVIDKTAGLIYVVGGCQDNSGKDRWYLHALVLTTGADTTGYPVRINGSVPSSNNAAGSTGSCGAYPATGCSLSFNEKYQLQRPALLQARNDTSGVNEIYVAFAISSNYAETNALNQYHGWLFGYNAGASSAQLTFATTPTGLSGNSYTPACSNPLMSDYSNWCGHGGGIWKTLAADTSSANIFVASGNGGFQSGGYSNWGESVMRFAVNGSASPADSFTPGGFTTLNQYDQDMGTSGQLLFQANIGTTPTNLLVTFDKTGEGYVLYQSALGGNMTSDGGAQSKFLGAYSGAGSTCDGTSPYSNYGGASDPGCDATHNQAFYSNTLFHWPDHEDPDMCAWNTSSTAAGFVCYPANGLSSGVFPVGYPGGMVAVTVDPNNSQITLWAIITGKNNLGGAIPTYANNGRGFLYAYAVTNLPTPNGKGTLTNLYNTPLTNTNDQWLASPFAVPTVVNGSVYVPTYDSGVVVYHQ